MVAFREDHWKERHRERWRVSDSPVRHLHSVIDAADRVGAGNGRRMERKADRYDEVNSERGKCGRFAASGSDWKFRLAVLAGSSSWRF